MNLCDIRTVRALLDRHGFRFSKSPISRISAASRTFCSITAFGSFRMDRPNAMLSNTVKYGNSA